MSQHCNLVKQELPFLEIEYDTTADDIINFVDGHGVVSFSSEGITIAFRTDEKDVDDIITLEIGDALVIIAGEMSVYTEDAFYRHFAVSEDAG